MPKRISRRRGAAFWRVENFLAPVEVNRVHAEAGRRGFVEAERRKTVTDEPRDVVCLEWHGRIRDGARAPIIELTLGRCERLCARGTPRRHGAVDSPRRPPLCAHG
jgi:hypothetical protein